MEKKNFYRTFFAMYVVLVLQSVVTLSVNLVDNMMLGAYSETALSGVAAVNQIQFVYQQLLNALGDGAVILCSQYWGRRQTEPMRRIVAIAMRFALVLAAALFLLTGMFPRQAVGLFTTDAAIVAEGAVYLRIVRFSYLFFAVSMILLAGLRSVGTVRIAFYLSVLSLVVNAGLNYLLIYGRCGMPELGASGAAVATLAARVIECGIVIWYAARKDHALKFRLRDLWSRTGVLLKDYLKITSPMLVVGGLWGVNTALQTAILGHMTTIAIAANSVASTLFLLVKSMAGGASSAASVMIGNVIGQGDMRQVRVYARRLQGIFAAVGIISGTLLFFLRIPVLQVYDLADETKAMANTFLIILSVVCAFMSYQMPVNNGIIRGGGSPLFVLKMDLISIWGIVLPLSFIMAFVVKASPVVVVICLNLDQIFKCVPAFIKVNYGTWARKLTREEKREEKG